MSHVTIVGSGIAALSAVLEALKQGTKITLVKGKSGGTALSSGAWDVAHNNWARPSPIWDETPSASDGLKEITKHFPFHPYTLLAKNQVRDLPELFSKAVERISNQLFHRIHGNVQKPFLALTPLGSLKPTTFVSASQFSGNVLEMSKANLLVVGFSGLGSFSASLVESFLNGNHVIQKSPFFEKITSTQIKLKKAPDHCSHLELAKLLDQDDMIDELLLSLIESAKKVRATHIALPPVIGVEKTSQIFARLVEATNLKWFETLALPPSLPGLRLQNAMNEFFKRRDITLIEGSVTCGIKEGGRVIGLKTSGGKDIPIEKLILTTGKFIGGGIESENGLSEPILGLPLLHQKRDVTKTKATRLTKNLFMSEQPLFQVGVRVGPNLQPVNDRGEKLFENLWAAGSLLGGYDPTMQGCGMGVSIATGTVAGRLASK